MGAEGGPAAEAAAAAFRGELIVFPTDTVYGIGTRPDDPDATALLFEAKHRPRGLTLPVLVPTREAARAVARFDERVERVALETWPGPVTFVLPRTPGSAAMVARRGRDHDRRPAPRTSARARDPRRERAARRDEREPFRRSAGHHLR